MNKIIFLLAFLIFGSLNCFAEIIEDEYIKDIVIPVQKPSVYTDYDFTSTKKLVIKLKPLDEIKSELKTFEGQVINFEVIEDVINNNEVVIKKGTKAKAKVGIIITTGMNGIPASIVFREFNIDGIKQSKLEDSYEKFGQDRSFLVFPLKWALTPLPPTGSLTNFIKGGHAKLKLKDVIKLGYYPDWK